MKNETKEGLDALKQLIMEHWDDLCDCPDLNEDELAEFISNFGELEEVFDSLENLNGLLENEKRNIK